MHGFQPIWVHEMLNFCYCALLFLSNCGCVEVAGAGTVQCYHLY